MQSDELGAKSDPAASEAAGYKSDAESGAVSRAVGRIRRLGRNAQRLAWRNAPPAEHDKDVSAGIALAVLGIVYGDIGTSPIYALRECFVGASPVAPNVTNVLGILSLVFWALVLVISLKYMSFVLRADNRGEGGTFALLALLRPELNQDRRRRRALILLGLLGASFLFGGAIITPAISVLSAVEGLRVAAPSLDRFVIPVTIGILVGLFVVQRHGTARVGAAFGPIMVVWFVVLALLGIRGIVSEPQVLWAVNPWYAVRFFLDNGWTGYFVLYAVFLVTTGGEALYADLGHFSRAPIRRVWFGVVLPALLLNYFGQGALLLADPTAREHLFFRLAPQWSLYPLVILAAAATSIASQAVITGAFSLVRQAMQLGFLPRLRVAQTSAESHGQIYLPTVNWFLLLAAIALVLVFRSSGSLAAAYGVAVNSTMAITTVLAFNVARERGGWTLAAALAFLLFFLAIDLGFLGSNAMQIPGGGWFPLVVGVTFFTVMTTWNTGARLLAQYVARASPDLETFLGRIKGEPPVRVPGTAVFVTGRLEQTPLALQQVQRHMGVLHERVIILTVIVEPVPKTSADERIELQQLGEGFFRVILRYGFMQGPNVPSELAACAPLGLEVDLNQVHYFVGEVDLFEGSRQRGMVAWRDRLFIVMARNTEDATAAYRIPATQTMKVGSQFGI